MLQEIWLKKDAQLLGRALWSKYVPIADGNKVTDALRYKLGGRKGGLLAFYHRMSQWVVPGATVASSFRQFQARAPWFRLWQADGISGKGIQRIELKQNGYRVVVLNTHLQSPYRNDECPYLKNYPYDDVRSKQIGELIVYADNPENIGAAVIAAGDLNITPKESELYGQITGAWEDLTKKYRNEYGSGTIMDEKGQRPEWIDYILSRRTPDASVRVSRLRLICNAAKDDPYSDHHGLEAQLFIPAAER